MNEKIIAFIVKEKKLLLLKQVKDGKQFFILPQGNSGKAETTTDALSRIVKEQCSFEVTRCKVIFQTGMEEYYFLAEEYIEPTNNWLSLITNFIKGKRIQRHSFVWKSFQDVKSNLTYINSEQDRDKIRLFIERETMTDKLMTISDDALLKQEGFITAPLDELGFNDHPTISTARSNELLRRSMEMQRRLKDEIERFNSSSSTFSVVLILLTVIMIIAVLVQIYLMMTKIT